MMWQLRMRSPLPTEIKWLLHSQAVAFPSHLPGQQEVRAQDMSCHYQTNAHWASPPSVSAHSYQTAKPQNRHYSVLIRTPASDLYLCPCFTVQKQNIINCHCCFFSLIKAQISIGFDWYILYSCTFIESVTTLSLYSQQIFQHCNMKFALKISEKGQIKISVLKNYLNGDSIWLKACHFDSKCFDFQDLMKNLKQTLVHEKQKRKKIPSSQQNSYLTSFQL